MSARDPYGAGPSSRGGDDALERRLREVLEQEAAAVRPAGDGLQRIRERTARQGWSRRWTTPVLVATTAAAAVVGTLVVTDQLDRGPAGPPVAGPGTELTTPSERPDETRDPSVGPTGSPEPSATSPPTGPADEPTVMSTGLPVEPASGAVPVYFLGAQPDEEGGGFRLFREYHDLGLPTNASREDRVVAALETMFRGTPDDADYATAWPASATVLSATVEYENEAVAVSLGGLGDWSGVTAPGGGPVEPLAETLVQQLVYTATAAASHVNPDDEVSIERLVVRLDGAEGDVLLGVPLAVGPSESVSRDPVDHLASAWLTGLVPVDHTAGSWELTTVALVASPPTYEVVQDGTVVAAGSTEPVGEAGGTSLWTTYTAILPDLPPGTYEVVVRSGAGTDSKPLVVGGDAVDG